MSKYGAVKADDLAPLDFGEGKATEPFLGKARLVSVDGESTTGKGDSTWDTLNFWWMLDTKPPTKYKYSEFWPSEDRDGFEDSVKNLMKRLAYILKYFIGTEGGLKVVNGDWDTWEDLKKRVIDSLSKVDFKKKVVTVKLIGNPSNLRVDFPKYIGFIGDENSEKPLQFSKSELIKNAQWRKAMTSGEVISPDDIGDSEDPDNLEF